MKENPNIIYIANRRLAGEAAGHSADSQLLDRVFREHEQALRRFLRARQIHDNDQEDLLQETFLRVARADNLAQRLSEKSGNTLTYLFSIATHLIIDQHRRAAARRQDHHESYAEDNMATEQPGPESSAEVNEQLNRLMLVLKKLKPKCRRAFILSRFEQKSYPEIAREMNLSVPSVERYITLALAALRKEINP